MSRLIKVSGLRKMRLLVIILVLGTFTSCELVLLDDTQPNNPAGNFDALWSILNERYAFFQIKNVDWDLTYEEFRPKINNEMRNPELFDVCFEMLETLRDGHIFLKGDANRREYTVVPVLDQGVFSKNVLFTTYLREQTEEIDGAIYRDFNDIGYLYYESFTDDFTQSGLDKLVDNLANKRGLIIDLRGNSGGNPKNAFRLAERLVPERREVIYSREKTGPGREDFSEREIFSVDPNSKRFDGPITILTSSITFSAANLFVAIMRNFDHVTLSGRPTGGGGGIPAVFELPNGWTFSYSASLITMPDGYVIENGFDPDFFVQISSGFVLIGRDTILEFSINNLRNRAN